MLKFVMLTVNFASLLLHLHLVCVLATDDGSENGFGGCNCEVEGFFGYRNIMETQRVSDFLIAVAYFSIPIELLYFVSCSNVPFKWVLFQFIAFIVLCGMTHLLNGYVDLRTAPFSANARAHHFQVPYSYGFLRNCHNFSHSHPFASESEVREFMLKKKTWDLGVEMGLMLM
ncbi:hypothetical protein LXL04_001968 [Taraxacum kok-saghyz]